MKAAKHIVIVLLMLMTGSQIQAQNKTITFIEGDRTFTARSAANSFQWYLNGVLQVSVTDSTYTATWDTGKYWLSVAPVAGGCTGDTFSILLNVVDSINNGVRVEWAVNSPVLVCPLSEGTNLISVAVNLINYTLNGETYTVTYTIDDSVPINNVLSIENRAVFDIDVTNLTTGNHTVKIIKLTYGPGGIYTKDYGSGVDAPLIILDVKPLPFIENIKY